MRCQKWWQTFFSLYKFPGNPTKGLNKHLIQIKVNEGIFLFFAFTNVLVLLFRDNIIMSVRNIYDIIITKKTLIFKGDFFFEGGGHLPCESNLLLFAINFFFDLITYIEGCDSVVFVDQLMATLHAYDTKSRYCFQVKQYYYVCVYFYANIN